ncbi:MAG: hypothetical protein IT329_23840, partial [Caldilineaceae bacterium]|nr:hypothetical protein [Caldilineaceae bacterium]
MRKRTALEWRFAEDPDEWERLTGLPTSVTRHSLPRRIVWAGLLALLVLLSGTGVWLWQTAQAGLATIETEVDAAANADLWAERQATAGVQLVNLEGGVAVVEVALPASAGLPGLRQTRVYRQTGDGWRRTPPSAALWGEVRRLETNHFVFDYRQL